MDEAIKNALKSWLPYMLVHEPDQALFRWLYVGRQPFTEPFFDDTISKCRRLAENAKKYKPVSDINMLAAWAEAMDNVVAPTAFIFHVSRCGSTLVSQALGMNDENISLSEVPVFDEILRMRFMHQTDVQTINGVLAAAIKLYGNKRNGQEKRLFIKTDSWHLMFYKELRALFPATPFVMVYRQPAEVLFSQQRQKGRQAVKGLIEPSVFGFEATTLKNVHPDDYMSLVLEKFFRAILDIANTDRNVLLVNYNEGIAAIIKKIARFVGMEWTDANTAMVAQRSKYHAKNGIEIFKEKYPERPIATSNMPILQNLYMEVENLRLQC